MEITNINLTDTELEIYLQEAGLTPTTEYDPTSNTNRRNILKSALAVLETIANDPQSMKNYKQDDLTVSQFHENLQSRINYLERKIRQIPNDDEIYQDGASFFHMFSN